MAMIPVLSDGNSNNEPAVQFDYNPKAEQAFRDYLRAKYNHKIQLLNDAWGTAFWSEAYSSFDEITLPKRVQMFMNHHQILVIVVLPLRRPMIF